MAQRAPLLSSLIVSQLRSTICTRITPSFEHRRNSSDWQLGPNNPFVKVSDEVREAINQKRPVVALETTIYTHGFPYPENTALASHLESVVRLNGGVPATIGVLHGIARVGFSAEELIELTASAGKLDTRKVSRRDLPYLLGLGHAGRKLNGGTTIAGTMVLARLTGIEVFATGGLGGVHRGGENSMDISADLTELGRTRMAVISSGCKSFLDIPRTLEYLETQGVCVGTFAERHGPVDFPAFWTRDSGTPSPLIISDEEEAASMIYAQRCTALESGMLLANPIPHEHSIAKGEMDIVIAQALQDADKSASVGSDNSPFVLKRIREITNGASVSANRALIEANVARGTKVAVHLARLHRSHGHPRSIPMSDANEQANQGQSAPLGSMTQSNFAGRANDVIVAGALAIDVSCNFVPSDDAVISSQPRFHTSNPASISQNLGGVGHNVATALHYMNSSVRLCTSIGDDIAGSTAIDILAKRGLQTCGVQRLSTGSHTAQYVAVNDAKKDLVLAMADMTILQDTDKDFHASWQCHLDTCKPKWLVVDANWDSGTLQGWLKAAKVSGTKVAYEPVSATKSQRIFPRDSGYDIDLAAVPGHLINLATPNTLELFSIHEAANNAGAFEREDWWKVINSIGLPASGSREKLVALTNNALVDQGVPQQSIRLLPFMPCILTTLGEQGVLLTQLLQPGDVCLTSPLYAPYILCRSTNGNAFVGGVYMRLFPPAETVPKDKIVSVNGVGDTFLGVIIAGLTKEHPKNIAQLVDVAQKASVMTLSSRETVSPQISALISEL